MAALFLDVTTACYSVIRDLLVPIGESDHAICVLLRRLNLEREDWLDLCASFDSTSAVVAAGATPAITGQIAAALSCTSFSVPCLPELAQAGAGTRPGDTMGGFCMGFFMLTLSSQWIVWLTLMWQAMVFPQTAPWSL